MPRTYPSGISGLQGWSCNNPDASSLTRRLNDERSQSGRLRSCGWKIQPTSSQWIQLTHRFSIRSIRPRRDLALPYGQTLKALYKDMFKRVSMFGKLTIERSRFLWVICRPVPFPVSTPPPSPPPPPLFPFLPCGAASQPRFQVCFPVLPGCFLWLRHDNGSRSAVKKSVACNGILYWPLYSVDFI